MEFSSSTYVEQMYIYMAALLSNCIIVAGTIIFPDYWTGSGLDQDKPLRPDQEGWG